ncbi:MAG: type II toxin-antitoxin system YafQ family toxin [bacterium]|nr:type II toxin-antitoxin system YafQ family toxin [bacterium]
MYTRKPTRSFKKSLKKIAFSGDSKIRMEIENVIGKLVNDEKLDKKHHDHPLNGPLDNCRGCHIRPDLILIYQVDDNDLILVDIGSHSELFG